MFFANRIKSINTNDYVLEIGPGGNPHPRSDVLLEKLFEDPFVAKAQRGHTEILKSSKQLVFFDGEKFPFQNKKFDYVICSHILEHVKNVDVFVREVVRVGKKGYLEFPTIYYDYLFNIPEHINMILFKKDVLYWLPKDETTLDSFKSIHHFFNMVRKQSYANIFSKLSRFLVQGFEWHENILSERATSLKQITYDPNDIYLPEPQVTNGQLNLVKRIFRRGAKALYQRLERLM